MLDATIEAAGDIEIDQLRQRLVDTEAAMERIVIQMGSLSRTPVVQSSHPDAQVLCQLSFFVFFFFSLFFFSKITLKCFSLPC